MAKKNKKTVTRHRLMVYYLLGQRWRTVPLTMVFLGLILYVLGWLVSNGVFSDVLNADYLNVLWGNRILIIALIAFSAVMYIFTVVMARLSYVEARPKALRIQAGFVPQDISYGRISQLRIVILSQQYPPDTLKNAEYAILEPMLSKACTAVDLNSWPDTPIRKLWHHFMFTREGSSLLLIVEDAMALNQQIDGRIAERQARLRGGGGYVDPIERAAQQARKSRGR